MSLVAIEMQHSASPRRPVRVLVVLPSLEVGGAEIDLLRNLPRLDRDRFEVRVWPYHAEGKLAPALREAGIEVLAPHVVRSALVNRGRPASMLRAVRAGVSALALGRTGARLIRRHRIDVVHAILPNGYLVASLSALLAGGRHLVMSRLSQNWYHRDLPMLGAIERHILHRHVSTAIGNSEVILDELRAEGIHEDKLRLVRNGIDVPGFRASLPERSEARAALSLPPDAFALTAVANLHRYKGHADLLQALHLVRDTLPQPWFLLVAGEDRQGNLASLGHLLSSLELAGNVRFLGARDDVPALLAAADLHASASHSEGLPNNILEAMCAGLPVVATHVGGVPELVADGETGRLVPARAPAELATAILELARDPTRRRRLGEAGRRRVEAQFSITRSVALFEAIYQQARDRRRGGTPISAVR